MKFNPPPLDKLTNEMKLSLNCTDSSITIGIPGTGKTVIAFYKFSELTQRGNNVVLICYNRLLSEMLGHKVSTIDQLYWKMRSDIYQSFDKKYFKECDSDEIKSVFEDYVKIKGKFDHLIVDEGQDLPNTFYEHIHILTEKIHIFMDDNQKLEDNSSSFEEILDVCESLHIREFPFELTRNFRNTREIYNVARLFVPADLMANNENLVENCPSVPDSMPIQEKNLDMSQQYEYIKNVLSASDGFSVGIFLSSPKLVDEVSKKLFQDNISHTAYHSKLDLHGISEKIVTTYLCSKGLEFDIVILSVNKGIADQDHIKNRLFVLSTRAKKKIYILFE